MVRLLDKAKLLVLVREWYKLLVFWHGETKADSSLPAILSYMPLRLFLNFPPR